MTVTIDDQKTHFSFLFFLLLTVHPNHFIIDYRRRRVPHMKASLLSTKREGWLLSYSNNCLQCYFYLIVLLKYFLVYRETIDDLKSLNRSLYLFKPFILWQFLKFIKYHSKYSIFTLCSLSNSFAIFSY